MFAAVVAAGRAGRGDDVPTEGRGELQRHGGDDPQADPHLPRGYRARGGQLRGRSNQGKLRL